MTATLFLLFAIAAEVAATTALKAADGFTRLLPSVVVVLGYGLAFLSLSYSLRGIPVGIAYATWAGLGTVCVSLLGWWIHEEVLDTPVVCGILLIVLGVGLINLHGSSH